METNVIIENLPFLLKSLKTTLSIALISILTSFVLGTILGVLRCSKLYPLNWVATVFIEITRSIPLILYIIFIHFSVSPIIYSTGVLKFLIGNSSLEFQSGFIALTLFTSAYIAEIVRSGINSIEKELINSAKSLGMNVFQRLRYVILPITFKRMTPSLISQFITLTKDTSLVSTIGLIELTRAGEIICERTFKEFEVLLFVALVYLVVCFSISYFGQRITKTEFAGVNG